MVVLPSGNHITVDEYKKEYPHAEIFIPIGSDQVLNLAKWKHIEKFIDKVGFIHIIRRMPHITQQVMREALDRIPDISKDAERSLLLNRLDIDLHDISSTRLKAKIRKREISSNGMNEVFDYIKEHKLYG